MSETQSTETISLTRSQLAKIQKFDRVYNETERPLQQALATIKAGEEEGFYFNYDKAVAAMRHLINRRQHALDSYCSFLYPTYGPEEENAV